MRLVPGRLRLWWQQMQCKHHWHFVEQDLRDGLWPRMHYLWECCWCEQGKVTKGNTPAKGIPPRHGRTQCRFNLYGIGRADIARMVIDEWSTQAQAAAMRKELPAIQRLLQPYRDSGQLR